MNSQASTNNSAPICLKGLFIDSDDSDEGEGSSSTSSSQFQQTYEVMDKHIGEDIIKVRQFSWHSANAIARGWSVNGKEILYSCERETAPTAHMRLWSVPATGGPSKLLSRHCEN